MDQNPPVNVNEWIGFALREAEASPAVLSFIALNRYMLADSTVGTTPKFWHDVSRIIMECQKQKAPPSLMLEPTFGSVKIEVPAVFHMHLLDMLISPPISVSGMMDGDAPPRPMTRGQAVFVAYSALLHLAERLKAGWDDEALSYQADAALGWLVQHAPTEVAMIFARHWAADLKISAKPDVAKNFHKVSKTMVKFIIG